MPSADTIRSNANNSIQKFQQICCFFFTVSIAISFRLIFLKQLDVVCTRSKCCQQKTQRKTISWYMYTFQWRKRCKRKDNISTSIYVRSVWAMRFSSCDVKYPFSPKIHYNIGQICFLSFHRCSSFCFFWVVNHVQETTLGSIQNITSVHFKSHKRLYEFLMEHGPTHVIYNLENKM